MILVTGGTGLVGSHLLYFLLKDGKDVRAIYRKPHKLERVKNVFSYYTDKPDDYYSKIEWVKTDINDIPKLTEVFNGVTHVYHVAAFVSFNPKHYPRLKKTNIEGTANIVNLCLENGVEKLCHVSSIATLGTVANGTLIDEETAWNPEYRNSVYAITKYGAEMEVWRGSQEGQDVVVINPGVILGSGHWNSSSGLIIKAAARGIKYYTSGGVGIVDVVDVVTAMLQLMASANVNEKYILVSENMYYKELLSTLSEEFGKKPPKKKIPKWVLNLIRVLDWLSSVLIGSRRKLLRSTVNSLYTVNLYNGSKIENTIDFRYTSYKDTIERIAKDYSRLS